LKNANSPKFLQNAHFPKVLQIAILKKILISQIFLALQTFLRKCFDFDNTGIKYSSENFWFFRVTPVTWILLAPVWYSEKSDSLFCTQPFVFKNFIYNFPSRIRFFLPEQYSKAKWEFQIFENFDIYGYLWFFLTFHDFFRVSIVHLPHFLKFFAEGEFHRALFLLRVKIR